MATGISCHIGLNVVDPSHYSGWSGPLAACEFDAQDLQDIAVSLGYNTQLLLTQQATRDAVISALDMAAATLISGDIFFLSYSGHGGQVPDSSGDERDLADETWCLYDGELIDDELHQLWSTFKEGVRVVVISDSCHSGTVTRMREMTMTLPEPYISALEQLREGSPAFRMMPVSIARKTYLQNRNFYEQIQENIPPRDQMPDIEARVRLISGCQDNQLSLDGTFNGLFTGTLKRIYAGGAFTGNYADFHRAIVGLMPPTQTPNHFVLGGINSEFDNQRPFLL